MLHSSAPSFLAKFFLPKQFNIHWRYRASHITFRFITVWRTLFREKIVIFVFYWRYMNVRKKKKTIDFESCSCLTFSMEKCIICTRIYVYNCTDTQICLLLRSYIYSKTSWASIHNQLNYFLIFSLSEVSFYVFVFKYVFNFLFAYVFWLIRGSCLSYSSLMQGRFLQYDQKEIDLGWQNTFLANDHSSVHIFLSSSYILVKISAHY